VKYAIYERPCSFTLAHLARYRIKVENTQSLSRRSCITLSGHIVFHEPKLYSSLQGLYVGQS